MTAQETSAATPRNGAGIARRTVTRGPWTVTQAPVAPEPPPWASLSAEDRERFQQWLATRESGQ